MEDEPYTIRSNFEQPGRPFDPENNYCLSFKENMCVVCGRYDKCMRKNVNPCDYLLYDRLSFPWRIIRCLLYNIVACLPCQRYQAERYQASLGNHNILIYPEWPAFLSFTFVQGILHNGRAVYRFTPPP